jgi:hypothetical protein
MSEQQELFEIPVIIVKRKPEIRLLTWKQPFADLMFSPHDKVETRGWDTKYRGWVAIHTAKQGYSAGTLQEIAGDQTERIYDAITDVPLLQGYIIGMAYLFDSKKMKEEDSDDCYVQYKEGLFCHKYIKAERIRPIPYKSKQGWSTLSLQFIKENNLERFLTEGKDK